MILLIVTLLGFDSVRSKSMYDRSSGRLDARREAGSELFLDDRKFTTACSMN